MKLPDDLLDMGAANKYKDMVAGAIPTDILTSLQVRIKAEPQAMEAKAASVKNSAAKLRQQYEELMRYVLRSSGYWHGEAADVTRSSFADDRELVEGMFLRLDGHAQNLLQIAQIYTQTETRVTAASSTLPKDAIE